MTFFLGFKVNQTPCGIFINQSKYLLEILEKYGMESCDPVGTPMEIKDKIDLDQNGTPVDAMKYRSMIGALMYLTSSRPNIVHDSGFKLTGFLDADYAGCKDTFKSTSGGAQFLDKKLEHVEKGTIELYFVKTDYQLDDLFTKALPADRFNYVVHRLGMRSLFPQELERLAKSHQSQGDLPRNTTLDRVEVIGMIEKKELCENKGIVPTEMELVLEQTQQGSSHKVLVSTEGVEELKRIVAVHSSLRVPNNKCTLIESRANEIHQNLTRTQIPIYKMISGWRYNMIPVESKFKTPCSIIKDKYIMKAQVHVSKSSAISDVQTLPRKKHYCQKVKVYVEGEIVSKLSRS
nr:hypothetical protein [Tanacetum cinerariifolium]